MKDIHGSIRLEGAQNLDFGNIMDGLRSGNVRESTLKKISRVGMNIPSLPTVYFDKKERGK